MASEITSLTIVYSTVYSRRRSKKTSKLRVTGLCAGIHRWPVNSPHKGPVTRKLFPFDDVIMRSKYPGHGCVLYHIHFRHYSLRIKISIKISFQCSLKLILIKKFHGIPWNLINFIFKEIIFLDIVFGIWLMIRCYLAKISQKRYILHWFQYRNSYFEHPSVSENGARSAKMACCYLHTTIVCGV